MHITYNQTHALASIDVHVLCVYMSTGLCESKCICVSLYVRVYSKLQLCVLWERERGREGSYVFSCGPFPTTAWGCVTQLPNSRRSARPNISLQQNHTLSLYPVVFAGTYLKHLWFFWLGRCDCDNYDRLLLSEIIVELLWSFLDQIAIKLPTFILVSEAWSGKHHYHNCSYFGVQLKTQTQY